MSFHLLRNTINWYICTWVSVVHTLSCLNIHVQKCSKSGILRFSSSGVYHGYHCLVANPAEENVLKCTESQRIVFDRFTALVAPGCNASAIVRDCSVDYHGVYYHRYSSLCEGKQTCTIEDDDSQVSTCHGRYFDMVYVEYHCISEGKNDEVPSRKQNWCMAAFLFFLFLFLLKIIIIYICCRYLQMQ